MMETESILGAYSSIDTFTLETAAGKPGFGTLEILEWFKSGTKSFACRWA